MDTPASLSAETLIEHEHFVRAVARGLLGDADEAGDVVQDTWLRTLRGGPRAGGNLRAWLGRVAGNLARDRRRGAARRTTREERTARAEAQESVHASYERLSMQRDVVAAILALDEPYRSVVLLRYHHGLAPQEVAERLGAKPATVRTQLARAHELLRARLDSRYGREAWAAALLPAAAAHSVVGAAAVAVGTVIVGVAALWLARRERAHVTSAARVELAAAVDPVLEAREPPQPGAVRREPVATVPAPPAMAGVATAGPRPAELESLSPRAELYAQDRYGDHELATFSFELGLRDDPTHVAGDDWDVKFNEQAFKTRIHVDDQSVLVDLGELPLRELWTWSGPLGTPVERATVRRGHTYFLWSRDLDTDLAAAFEVLELTPEDRCVLEWYATSDGRSTRASFRDESPGAQLARRLIELRDELRRPGELTAPRVRLQARGGDAPGNPYRVDMAGGLTHVARLSPAPLDLLAPIDSRETAFCEGGFVPEGQVFVITHATYRGTALENPHQARALALVIAGELVVEEKRAERFSGTWDGWMEVPPGEEAQTYLELCNATAGEVELSGRLVARPGLLVRARPSEPRQTRDPGPAPTLLREPRARLQGRKGDASPNEIRIRLDGSLSLVHTRSETPLDLDATVGRFEPGIAYCEGETVPPGRVFVVTRVDYSGTVNAAGSGQLGFAVVLAGTRIVEHKLPGEIAGTWQGRIEIPEGREKLAMLEIRNSSAAEAILYGEFMPRSRTDASGSPDR